MTSDLNAQIASPTPSQPAAPAKTVAEHLAALEALRKTAEALYAPQQPPATTTPSSQP